MQSRLTPWSEWFSRRFLDRSIVPKDLDTIHDAVVFCCKYVVENVSTFIEKPFSPQVCL